jgi:hypothetical protein
MHTKLRFPIVSRLTIVSLALAAAAHAGPPFITDDPEPVDFKHWEVYLATQQIHNADGWSGTAPHLEINYGVVPEVQLHLIAPFSYNTPAGGRTTYGYGDTELGFKWRFIKETDNRPQIGIFPLVELPTGDSSRGLGNGKAQFFLPIWLQKKFGDWSTYGGGGYWFNPGDGNRNWWYAGWQVQRKITEPLALGAEIQYRTADTVGGHSSVALNGGGIWDLNKKTHILFSAGHTIAGRSEFQGYLALQFTFGPEEEKPVSKK